LTQVSALPAFKLRLASLTKHATAREVEMLQRQDAQGKVTWQRAWRQVYFCLYLSNIITIQAALLKVLAPVCLQGLALIQSAFPAVITLLVWSLHALAMYTESCGTTKLFA